MKARRLAALISVLVFLPTLFGVLACLTIFGGFIGAPILSLVGPLFLYGVQIAGGSYPVMPWYTRWAMGSAGLVALLTLRFAIALSDTAFPTAVMLAPVGWSAALLGAGWAMDQCRA